MAALRLIETLVLLVAAWVAIRRGRPAPSPYGRRMAWIGFLLVIQLIVLGISLAIQLRTSWGANPEYAALLAFGTQALRIIILLAATSAWFGLVRGELVRPWQLVLGGLCVVALGWGVGPLRALAAIALAIGLNRMKWIENVGGWRRAIGFLVSAALLIALSLVSIVTFLGASGRAAPSPAPGAWHLPVLLVDLSRGAATGPSLMQPLDHATQALTDLMRVQLAITAFKLLFLPIRLAGTSLKRRFTIHSILVRSVPTFFAGLTLAGVSYLALGYTRIERIRAGFESTLASATTVAEALALDPTIRGGAVDTPRLKTAPSWMGVDGASARVAIRAPRAPGGAFPIDSASAAGLVVVRDSLWLAARRSIPGGAVVEVTVPLDSAYLARLLRPIGGDLTVRAQPELSIGSYGVRWRPDSTRAEQPVIARARAPWSHASNESRWFLGRSFVPLGDWSHGLGEGMRGAAELQLAATPSDLLRSFFMSLGALQVNLVTILGILFVFGAIFSTIEGIAVRAGRSIVQAVLEEAATLRTAAERFGAGHLDHRLPVRGDDEFSVVADSFNQMAANLARQREELMVAERAEADLAVARGIQQRFLPQQPPELNGFDVAGVSLPSREVGGDLFYWFPHEDGSLGLALGDVSGKSVPAALLMSNVLAALRSQAMMSVGLADSLDRVSRFIAEQVESGRFVTLFYAEADAARGTVRYASAGHNPPLLMRADGRLEWLREGGVPLGVLPESRYSETTIAFDPGDTLIVYSDGVTEAAGPRVDGLGATGESSLLGEERVAEVVRSNRGVTAQAMLEAVLRAVREFAKDEPQSDDITLVVVKRT